MTKLDTNYLILLFFCVFPAEDEAKQIKSKSGFIIEESGIGETVNFYSLFNNFIVALKERFLALP